MSYVFWQVPSLIRLRPEKRYSRLAFGWNVWGFHELGLFWRVPRSNYDKKRYSCLAIGCNVGLFWRFCPYVFWWVPQLNYKIRPEKKVQLSGHVGIRVKIRTLTMTGKNYDRKKKVQSSRLHHLQHT